MKQKGRVKFVQKDNNAFFPTLKARVDAYFQNNNISPNANAAMVLKSIAMLSMYILPFIYLLTYHPGIGISIFLWTLMGLGMAGIGMSVMHDANHGAYSSNSFVNKFMGSLINLLGASGFNWKLQHNVLHHTYTNVDDMDDDIADKPMLRFSPYSPISKFHQYQWLYAFLFYGLTTLYWVVAKDFVQFNKYKKNGVNNNSKAQNRIVLSKIILLKTIYFSIILFVPIFIFHIPALQVLSGFLWMHFISGIILTVIFQLAHTVEGTSYPLPDEKGIIEKNWAIHQMETTVNFSRKNRIISWYVGGLNFQVEHHLFPRISHIHYPEISEIVKSTAQEFNVPYLENETFWDAFRSHIAALKKMGSLPDLNEVLN